MLWDYIHYSISVAFLFNNLRSPMSFQFARIAGMLIELQSVLADRSVLSKMQLLADDVDQWTSVLSKAEPGKGNRTGKHWRLANRGRKGVAPPLTTLHISSNKI